MLIFVVNCDGIDITFSENFVWRFLDRFRLPVEYFVYLEISNRNFQKLGVNGEKPVNIPEKFSLFITAKTNFFRLAKGTLDSLQTFKRG